MTRKVLWAVLVVGVLMLAAPFAFALPTRASAGEDMLGDFEPIMQPDNVKTTAMYYNDVFVPLGEVVPAMSAENVAKFQSYVDGMKAMGADAEKLLPMMAAATGMTVEQVQQLLVSELPAMSQLLQALPQMQQDFDGFLQLMQDNVGIFEQVPAGLDHYRPLVTTMQANVSTYRDVSRLPSFDLFTWFFLVPGLVLSALSLVGLFWHRRPTVATVSTSRPVHA
jgi:hypothetical protein